MSIFLDAFVGAALSAVFDALIDKLISDDLSKIFRQENVDADLKKWTRKLRSIRAVLIDAEEKQMTDEVVKIWLAELEDLAYDADDILDEFATEALRRKVKAEEPSTSNVRKFFPACCLGLNPSSIMFNANMRSKIKEINTKLQEIVTQKNDLKLEDSARGRTRIITSRDSENYLVEPHTYGREEDKENIVELLTGGSGGAQLSTISILGMGGLGKTTLAKLVYNDDKVGSYFEVKAWVCVSQNFDILRVTKKILQHIKKEKTCKDDELDIVQCELKEQLSGKKFLFILDDVWNENYPDWTKLCLPFESGAPGSKILITTRLANVSTMGATHPYELSKLSNNACLAMFTQHALGTSDFVEHLKVEERKKILERCKGLPLAAKALAGLLRTYDRHEWKDVLNGRIWDLLEEKTDVPSTLRLSYMSLPSSLKKCFAYCSLFPKDYDFEEEKLVLLWMAEGLVRETKREKTMEDLGGEYFRELLKRSFFQQSSICESRFVMHDLMHDLAQWAAGDLYCILEDQLGDSKISTKVRHFSYIGHSINCIKKFDYFPKDMHLRTFLLLTSRFSGNLTDFDANFLLPQLRYLRVLSLDKYDICELPSSIGDLKHLRYLSLSYTKITSLPESTSSLYNLQTLILKGCSNLKELPEKIENLVNLRHLNIASIREMPSSIGDLKHLRYLNLSYSIIESLPESTSSLYNLQTLILKGCPNLKELPEKIENLVNLRHLNITEANSIKEMPAGIAKLKSLRTLCFGDMHEWQDWVLCRVENEDFPCLRELSISNCPRLEGKFSHNLPSLEKLSIYACEQLVVSIPSLSKLKEVKIVECEEVVHGSVKVEKLIIKNCEKLTSLCEDGLMSFATLEIEIESCQSLVNIKLKSTLRTLTIKDCNALESLQFVTNECEEFPCLRELFISNCPKLEGKFPHHLPSLERLSIEACEQLVVSIPNHSVLQVLKIVGCKEVVHESVKVEKLIIKNCEKLTSLCEDELMSLATQEIEIQSCQSLVNIKLKSMLRKLTISDCSALESLEFVIDEGGASSTSSLLMNEENLSCIGNNNASLLEHLEISNCPSLKCVSTIVDLAAMLERLHIDRCPNLTSLSSKDTLPTTLKVLSLDDCPKLESIVDKLDKDRLLEDLFIHSCEKLRCLPRGLHELCHLKEIDIYECNSLISLGDLLPTNLISLGIGDCEKLEALPNNIHNLHFLQVLLIRYCPSIVSFPVEGFPTSLRELRLFGANLCEQVFELGLHRLTSLTLLVLRDGIMDSFPEEEDGKTMLMLPTSLTTLKFYNFPNLLFLSWKFFQNLSALEKIYIYTCPKLASLSEKCFPPSLQRLEILACPVLKQNCEKDKGIMWSKIANIPSVIINFKGQQK